MVMELPNVFVIFFAAKMLTVAALLVRSELRLRRIKRKYQRLRSDWR